MVFVEKINATYIERNAQIPTVKRGGLSVEVAII